MIGMALFAVLMCVNFASCSSSDDEPETDDMDFTVYTSTNLKINGLTFWYSTEYSGVNFYEYNNSFGFVFQDGKLSNGAYAGISLEELPQSTINSNKNIATDIRFQACPNPDGGLVSDYKYTSGRISVREENGIFKINFNNAVFQNYEINDKQTLNGDISFRL